MQLDTIQPQVLYHTVALDKQTCYSCGMTTTMPTIEIPRLEGESARAYEARVRYVTMGPSRSIDKAADQLGIKTASNGRARHLLGWAQRYDWVESARRYDEAVTYLTVQDAAGNYRAQLEEQRTQAFKLGTEMLDAAREMLSEIMARRQAMDYRPGDLATIAKVAMAGLEARSHALNIDRLMEMMEQQS